MDAVLCDGVCMLRSDLQPLTHFKAGWLALRPIDPLQNGSVNGNLFVRAINMC